MVSNPADYRWSSYRANAQGESSPILSYHPIYDALGTDMNLKQHHYRYLFEHQIDIQDLHAIRKASQFSTPLGNDRFKQQIEAALGRTTGFAKLGRPGIKEGMEMYSR
jgi:putative transposase